MTAVLYLLIALLIFFVIGYILAKTGCTTGERYLHETPVDPVTADDGSCEDADILKAQKEAEEAEAAKLAEAQRLRDEEEAAKAEAEAEEAARLKAEKRAAEDAKAKAEAEKAAEEAAKQKAADEKAAALEAKAQTAQQADQAKVSEGESNPEEIAEAEEHSAVAPEGLLDAPRNGKKDNLTKIKGIGIKIDAALNSIGIWHFDQIAVWTEEHIAWADRELAFPGRAKRDDWVGQAKLLAAGKETEFSKRVKAGKVSSSKQD